MFGWSDYKSDGLGGRDGLLSVSGKYGSLCRFPTGEGDLLSCFPEPGW